MKVGNIVKSENKYNALEGKTLYAFGTSIINGHLANKSFIDDICKDNDMNYSKFCVNGATTRTESDNNIIDQIRKAPDAIPDLIVFDSIANDAYRWVTDNPQIMGEMSDGYEDVFNTETYCGALEKICSLLAAKYPGAKILYVATHKTPARDLRVQNIMYDCSIRIMHKWSISVADLYTEGNLNCFIPWYQYNYSYDSVDENGGNHSVGGTGTHPNADGYRIFYTPMVMQSILKLV